MPLPITAIYAGLLAFLLILLSLRVIGARRGARVALGDGADEALRRRIRVHANFAEYAPMALVLLGLAEGLGTPSWLVHALGVTLLCGRISHAWGVSRTPEDFRFRVAGMAMTFAVLGIAAVLCLGGAALLR